MSVVTDMLDRLSGVAVVREKLNDTAQKVDRVAEWLLDHERRLVRLEERTPPPKSKRLPKQ
jgi:hypothetical protein